MEKNISEYLPKPEFHASYITYKNYTSCIYLTHLPWEEMCAFSLETPTCHETVVYFNYIDILFCKIPPNQYIFYLAVLLLGCLLLMIITIVISNGIVNFAPNILAITKSMKLDEYTSGAIILGVIYSIPKAANDFLHYEVDTALIFNESLGISLALTGFYCGILIIIYPFKVYKYFYLRDSLFHILTNAFISMVFVLKQMHFYQSSICGIIIILYISCIIGQYIYFRRKSNSAQSELSQNDSMAAAATTSTSNNSEKSHPLAGTPFEPLEIRFKSEEGIVPNDANSANYKIFEQFFKSLNPIKSFELRESGPFRKATIFLATPIRFLLLLLIPAVDYRLPNNGWSKLMNCLHLVILPNVYVLVSFEKPSYIPYICGPFILLAVIVFNTSRTDRPPKYHIMFACFGVFGCLLLFYVVIAEISSILQVFGILLGLNRSSIGVLFFAIGNTIGDVVLNYTLASWGYYKMAFAAFHNGPLFNTLFAFSIIFFLRCRTSPEKCFHARTGALGPTTAVFSLILLCYSLLYALLTKFQIRQSLGYFMIAMYIIFITHLIFINLEIIHGHGTDHAGSSIWKDSWA